MNMKGQKKLHYAWWIFISCLLLKIGLGGTIMCISGNFVTPVVEELGCKVSQFTMLVSVEAAAMALMYTTAARLLESGKIGRIMGFAALAEVAGVALMACYRSVYMFYLSGAIIGVGVAFTGYVAIPLVINMWFRKKAGTVLGIIVAAEGLSAVLYNKLTAALIVSMGWRSTYLVMAVISLILSVPALFIFIKKPSEVGIEPYGADSAPEVNETIHVEGTSAEWGLTKEQAVRKPVFYIVWLTCMMYSIGCGVQQYIATFSTMELGESIAFGATAAMCMSLGCVVSSIILGYVNDKFGVRAGLGWGAVFICAGYGMMLGSIGNHRLTVLASLLVGLGGSMYTVQCPLLARTVLGNKHYSSIWSLMMMGNSLIGAFSFGPIGLFYDKTGSYRGAFIMAICLYVAAFACGSIAVAIGRKYRSAAK